MTKSLCLDRLPTGCVDELERWRMSVQTVGRCFTDCRHRCSPSQNLGLLKKKRRNFFFKKKSPYVRSSHTLTRTGQFAEKPGSSSQHRRCQLPSRVLQPRATAARGLSLSILTSRAAGARLLSFPVGYELRLVFIALQIKSFGSEREFQKQLVLNDV